MIFPFIFQSFSYSNDFHIIFQSLSQYVDDVAMFGGKVHGLLKIRGEISKSDVVAGLLATKAVQEKVEEVLQVRRGDPWSGVWVGGISWENLPSGNLT